MTERVCLAAGEQPDPDKDYTLIICEPGRRGTSSARHTRGITYAIPPEALEMRLPDMEKKATREGNDVIYIQGMRMPPEREEAGDSPT